MRINTKTQKNISIVYLHSDEHVWYERGDGDEHQAEPEHERAEQHAVHAAHDRADQDRRVDVAGGNREYYTRGQNNIYSETGGKTSQISSFLSYFFWIRLEASEKVSDKTYMNHF